MSGRDRQPPQESDERPRRQKQMTTFFQGAHDFDMKGATFNSVEGDLHVHNKNKAVKNVNSNNRAHMNLSNTTNNTSNTRAQAAVFTPGAAAPAAPVFDGSFGFVREAQNAPAPRRKRGNMRTAGAAVEAANYMGSRPGQRMIAAGPSNPDPLASQLNQGARQYGRKPKPATNYTVQEPESGSESNGKPPSLSSPAVEHGELIKVLCVAADSDPQQPAQPGFASRGAPRPSGSQRPGPAPAPKAPSGPPPRGRHVRSEDASNPPPPRKGTFNVFMGGGAYADGKPDIYGERIEGFSDGETDSDDSDSSDDDDDGSSETSHQDAAAESGSKRNSVVDDGGSQNQNEAVAASPIERAPSNQSPSGQAQASAPVRDENAMDVDEDESASAAQGPALGGLNSLVEGLPTQEGQGKGDGGAEKSSKRQKVKNALKRFKLGSSSSKEDKKDKKSKDKKEK
ncbi:hypothetical protein AX16_000832 [Volvariella volvacea WC 439]|nr:hypothetical protein AX16_000832 [Volvariella volvacea WC 439]